MHGFSLPSSHHITISLPLLLSVFQTSPVLLETTSFLPCCPQCLELLPNMLVPQPPSFPLQILPKTLLFQEALGMQNCPDDDGIANLLKHAFFPRMA